MTNKYYLYCNSWVSSSFEEKLGWLKDLKKVEGRNRVVTTSEFAFAKEFNSREEAMKYNNKHKLPCIVFERHYERPA